MSIRGLSHLGRHKLEVSDVSNCLSVNVDPESACMHVRPRPVFASLAPTASIKQVFAMQPLENRAQASVADYAGPRVLVHCKGSPLSSKPLSAGPTHAEVKCGPESTDMSTGDQKEFVSSELDMLLYAQWPRICRGFGIPSAKAYHPRPRQFEVFVQGRGTWEPLGGGGGGAAK